MHTDPIADMLTRIRNAARVKKGELLVPYSRMKFGLAKILEREGYILSAEKVEEARAQIRIRLKYQGDRSVISQITRISKPGHRKYAGKDELPVVRNNYGITVVSTSKGVMTNKEARKAGVGGEVLFMVY